MTKDILIIFLIVFMCSCSTVQVTYDYDKGADFSKYKTYAYSEESQKLPIDQINRRRVFDAVNNLMVSKGFSESKDCDLIVDLHLKATQMVQATATTTGAGYGPYRYGWGAGYSTTRIDYNEHTDGTMFISFVDAKTKKLVWQGIGTRTINEDLNPDRREESINYSISQILNNYPPQ